MKVKDLELNDLSMKFSQLASDWKFSFQKPTEKKMEFWNYLADWAKLASFKGDQRPYRDNAASNMGAAVLAHVARSGQLAAAHRWTKPITEKIY